MSQQVADTLAKESKKGFLTKISTPFAGSVPFGSGFAQV